MGSGRPGLGQVECRVDTYFIEILNFLHRYSDHTIPFIANGGSREALDLGEFRLLGVILDHPRWS